MERIAVFLNDAEAARRQLRPLLAGPAPTHWTLVACPPPLTSHLTRRLSSPAKRAWRQQWADELHAALRDGLPWTPGSQVEAQVATGPLHLTVERLRAAEPHLRVLDVRQPRLGQAQEPLDATSPQGRRPGWAGTVAAAGGLAAFLTLAD